MSFLANLASVLRPLREFGFFMGACVVSAWLIMFFGCPPLLILGERCHRRMRHTLGGVPKDSVTIQPGARRSVAMVSRKSSVALAAMLDPEKKGVGDMHSSFLGERFADFLRDWKCCLLIVFTILTVGSLGMAFKNVQQASGAPMIFPPDHNQVLGKEYDSKFRVFDKAIADQAAVFATECNDLFEDCTQFRCETSGRAMGSATDCACYPHGVREGNCGNPYKVKVNFRVLGRQGLPKDAVKDGNWERVLSTRFPTAKSITRQASNTKFEEFECLVQNWESGKQMLATLITAGEVEARVRDLGLGEAGSVCNEKQICYCGVERCEGSGSGLGHGSLQLTTLLSSNPGGRRLTPSSLVEAALTQRHPHNEMTRRLSEAATEVRPSDLVDVSIILGMKVVGKNPLLGVSAEQPWQFQPDFNLQDPWAQREFEKLCKTMKDEEDLKIGSSRCWLLGFRDSWVAKGKDWPVRPTEDMNAAVFSYANSVVTDGFQTTTYFWFEGSKVKATYIVFFLSVSKHVSSTVAMEIKSKWDAYESSFNARTAKSTSITGIFHASKLWVRAEAEKVILDSTIVTLGISLGCVFLGIFLFTQSVHLAFLVMLVVMSIIICLLFFMVVMMEWPIGAIEVLSLIVFVGFAVDYCLHVAHKYHTCHINTVQEITPEEDDVISHISSESPTGSSFGRRSTGSGRASRISSKRRASIAVQIDDRPAPMTKDTKKQSTVNFKLLAANRPEERFSRTRYALERMGGAVVGSAFTTAGCAAFLLPCQLAIFTKIGSVVMAVTTYAILYTLLPLPALLMACGPCGHDMEAVLSFFKKQIKRPPKEVKSEQIPKEPERPMVRRYVLHMPTRAMSTVGPGIPATRTRVTASG